MTMPVLQGRSFAAIPQPALSSCSVGCCGRWPDAAAGHRLPPRHPHSRALQQPPLLPLSSTRDALPLPSPPGSPVNYFFRPRFYCFALCNIWHARTILIKDRRRTKLILRGEKIEWVCFQITSTLSNFFNCGSVRRTESMKINCQTCVCVSVCLCVCVWAFSHLCVCRPSSPPNRDSPTSSGSKVCAKVAAKAPMINASFSHPSEKFSDKISLNTSDKAAILFFLTKSSLRLQQCWKCISNM